MKATAEKSRIVSTATKNRQTRPFFAKAGGGDFFTPANTATLSKHLAITYYVPENVEKKKLKEQHHLEMAKAYHLYHYIKIENINISLGDNDNRELENDLAKTTEPVFSLSNNNLKIGQKPKSNDKTEPVSYQIEDSENPQKKSKRRSNSCQSPC